jgi:hypothetical protein
VFLLVNAIKDYNCSTGVVSVAIKEASWNKRILVDRSGSVGIGAMSGGLQRRVSKRGTEVDKTVLGNRIL